MDTTEIGLKHPSRTSERIPKNNFLHQAMICCRKNDKNFRFWVFWAKILLKKLSFYSKISEEKFEKLEVANLVSFGMLYVRQFSLDWWYVFSSAREGSLQQALALAPGRASAREALVRSTLVVGYRLNRLDEPVFMAVSKPLLTEFGIHHRLESCDHHSKV